jgi:hypothetical protein
MLVMKKKPSPSDLTDLTRGELEVIIVTLWDRLAALETKVDKNSSNFSKPPSSDGLVKKTRSLREASGKPAWLQENDAQAGRAADRDGVPLAADAVRSVPPSAAFELGARVGTPAGIRCARACLHRRRALHR